MTHYADAPELDAARLLLAKMGVTPEDLLGTAAPKPQAPTFADYIPEVATAVSAGTKRVYGTSLRDLDPDQCLLLLHEKGETVRWQPVPPPS